MLASEPESLSKTADVLSSAYEVFPYIILSHQNLKNPTEDCVSINTNFEYIIEFFSKLP